MGCFRRLFRGADIFLMDKQAIFPVNISIFRSLKRKIKLRLKINGEIYCVYLKIPVSR